ncbi:LCP family protein [Amycolatopsis solani]|uniref:LCP family protein n=1 Tax=Amycolatopsis solani TaxID=3028615 RepID=UPI0025B04528|nr:LCP family protein [Amycolatopsis sp. MEP2-6]
MSRIARRRWYRVAGRVALVALAVLTIGVTAYGWHLQRVVTDGLGRLPGDVFAGLPSRPAPAAPAPGEAKPPVTVMLLGSDRREGPDVGGGVTGERADSILLAHFAAGHRKLEVLSVPRDAWVPIPGHGSAKINASLSLGGVGLVVRTVEDLTGVRIDHVVVADFAGVRRLTTELGGVPVDNPVASTDPQTRTHFDAGPIVLEGDRALTFVRQRYGLPHGDLDRIGRQHLLLSALGRDVAAKGLTDPDLLSRVFGVVHDTVSADAGLTPDRFRELFLDVATLPPNAVSFHTAPVSGSGRAPDGQAYLTLDRPRLAAAADALRAGRPVPLPATLSPS